MAKRESDKRAQRRRDAKAGRLTIQVEIMDREAWVELLREEGHMGKDAEPTPEAIRDVTVKLIYDDCRQYRKEVADEEMGRLHRAL